MLQEHEPWTIVVYLRMPADELDGFPSIVFITRGGDPDVLVQFAEMVHAELTQP